MQSINTKVLLTRSLGSWFTRGCGHLGQRLGPQSIYLYSSTEQPANQLINNTENPEEP